MRIFQQLLQQWITVYLKRDTDIYKCSQYRKNENTLKLIKLFQYFSRHAAWSLLHKIDLSAS